MPQAQDIVTKDNAGTTVTFTCMSPAAGDGAIASYMEKGGVAPIVNNTITVSAAKTGVGSRKVTVKQRFPASYVDPVTGLPKVTSAIEVNSSVSVPDLFPEAMRDDVLARHSNVWMDPSIQKAIRDALSLT